MCACASASPSARLHLAPAKVGMAPKKKSGKSTKSGGHKPGSRPPGSRKAESAKAKERRLAKEASKQDGRD